MSYLDQNDSLWKELSRLAQEDGLSLYDVERMGDQGLRVVLARGSSEPHAAPDSCSEAPRSLCAAQQSVFEASHSVFEALHSVSGASASVMSASDVGVSENGSGNGSATEVDPSRSQSVTSKQCSRFCKRLMVFFSVEGPRFRMAVEPQIEVSSPGINRVLRMQEHFANAVGERVKITLGSREGGVLIGLLEQCGDDLLTVRDEATGLEVELPLAEVKKARVDFRF